MINDPQLVQELVGSGLPPEIHDQLGYCSVTVQEAKKLTGHEQEGWVVPYLDPDGKPYQHNGKDFYRLCHADSSTDLPSISVLKKLAVGLISAHFSLKVTLVQGGTCSLLRERKRLID